MLRLPQETLVLVSRHNAQRFECDLPRPPVETGVSFVKFDQRLFLPQETIREISSTLKNLNKSLYSKSCSVWNLHVLEPCLS